MAKESIRAKIKRNVKAGKQITRNSNSILANQKRGDTVILKRKVPLKAKIAEFKKFETATGRRERKNK